MSSVSSMRRKASCSDVINMCAVSILFLDFCLSGIFFISPLSMLYFQQTKCICISFFLPFILSFNFLAFLSIWIFLSPSIYAFSFHKKSIVQHWIIFPLIDGH